MKGGRRTVIPQTTGGAQHSCWAEAHIKIARMTLTIKLDGNWNSFQLANNTPPPGVTGSVIAPSARMACVSLAGRNLLQTSTMLPFVSASLRSGNLLHPEGQAASEQGRKKRRCKTACRSGASAHRRPCHADDVERLVCSVLVCSGLLAYAHRCVLSPRMLAAQESFSGAAACQRLAKGATVAGQFGRVV